MFFSAKQKESKCTPVIPQAWQRGQIDNCIPAMCDQKLITLYIYFVLVTFLMFYND